MAKRTQASRSAHRPGGQGPSRAKKTSGTEPSSGNPVDAEVSAAEDIGATYSDVEVDEVAAAAVAAAATSQATEAPPAAKSGRRVRRRAARTSKKKRNQDDLAARSAAETVWVRADLRRIGIVSIVLFVALAVAYVIFGVVDVLNLY